MDGGSDGFPAGIGVGSDVGVDVGACVGSFVGVGTGVGVFPAWSNVKLVNTAVAVCVTPSPRSEFVIIENWEMVLDWYNSGISIV